VRILFLEVDTERAWAVASVGPAFIGAYLRAHGHEVELLRADVDMDEAAIVARVRAAEPDLLGVSLTTRQWLRGRAAVGAIRAEIDVPVIAGGLHPTFSPEEVLAAPGFDYVCLGEGEAALLDLVTRLAAGRKVGLLTPVANIWAKGGAKPTLRAPFEPLDALPFVARDLLDEHPGVVHMTTQRGCPFPCTYCAARMYNELYEDTGEYGRRRSHASVLAELAGLRDAGKLAYVIFLDDTFTINHGWVKEFCKVYGAAFHAPFSLHARVETVSDRLLPTLAAAGAHMVTYGVESGSERIRREVMKRPVTNQRFRDVFRWTRDAGITITANFMLGLPDETRDDLEMTLELAEELATTSGMLDFGYFVFYPYPGTLLFKLCQERGYLPRGYEELPANHRASILALDTLTPDDIAEYYDRFTALRRRLYADRYGDAASRVGAAGHVDTLAQHG
jgi:radical SAM superfamily enzyme YgiQ (UPF0313 family)